MTVCKVGFDLGLFTVADRFDQQVTQRSALKLELAEHIENLAAKRLPRLFEFLQQLAINISLARIVGQQIPQVADLGLADTMDTSKTLFQAVGIPRQVIVNH